MTKIRVLNGNMLKILAAVCMVIDHMGLMFFPTNEIFRIIGRLAYPIFAFMISEGARYTKNKLKYFLTIFSLATVCQVVYYFFNNGSLYMCILVTFSLSILMIYALSWFKSCLFDRGCPYYTKILSLITFLGSVALVFLLNAVLRIDYGFVGCMAPVVASLFDFRGTNPPSVLLALDRQEVRVLMFALALLALSIGSSFSLQYYCLIAIIPLLLYSGKRGRMKMKYFFYLFYPLHLVALEAIYLLIKMA